MSLPCICWMAELACCCCKTTEPCLRAEACRFIVSSLWTNHPTHAKRWRRRETRQKRHTCEGHLKERIINSTLAAHNHYTAPRYIMHKLHYHKHVYLYPLARSLLCAASEEERFTWVFLQRVNCNGNTMGKKKFNTNSQDCSHRLNFAQCSRETHLISSFILLLCVHSRASSCEKESC